MKLGNTSEKFDYTSVYNHQKKLQRREVLIKKIKNLEIKKEENSGSLPVVSDSVVLHPELGISVKRVRPVEEDTEVVVAYDGSPFSQTFGSAYESVARVIGSEWETDHLGKPTRRVLIMVHKNSKSKTVAYAHNVVAYDDYLDYLKEKGKPSTPVPIFKADQVLYVKPHPKCKPGIDYPCIGSDFETDTKVIDVEISEFGNHVSYRCYTPQGGYLTFKEEYLTTAAERLKYIHKDFKEAVMASDAGPFFKKDEKVKTFDGYLYNMDETVVVKLNEELKKLLI